MEENYLKTIKKTSKLYQIFNSTNSKQLEHKFNFYMPYKKQKLAFKADMEIYTGKDTQIKASGWELTLLHKNIIDIILCFGRAERDRYYISTYAIQKLLGYKSRNNQTFIYKKLEEIKETTIKIKMPQYRMGFNIIDSYFFDTKKGECCFVFNQEYIALTALDFNINYSTKLEHLLTLSQYTQIIGQYFFTFQGGHQINIDKLLENALKITKENTKINTYNKIKREVLKELEENKDFLNIKLIKTDLKNTTIKYIRPKEIKILKVKEQNPQV